MTLPYAWSCLECPDSGAGPKSDLAARKHEEATTHATTTHLERPEWREPLLVGEVAAAVVARLAAREGRRAVPGVAAEARENEGGPEGASTPESPALDQRSSVEGSASRGL